MNARFDPPAGFALPVHPLDYARERDDLRTRVFACILHEGLLVGRQPLIRGIAESEFQRLLAIFFPGLKLENGAVPAGSDARDDDEFTDLVQLLLEYRELTDPASEWLASAVATAALGQNHLWQDMGLPNRQLLSRLMQEHFTGLAEKNVGDMKWKKFFYRQLCERADVLICKSPHCAECCDYAICFNHDSD